jgi:hypothetical protein
VYSQHKYTHKQQDESYQISARLWCWCPVDDGIWRASNVWHIVWHWNVRRKLRFFIAWELGIWNATLLWGWWQDYTLQVTLFTVVKTECYVNWTMYVSLKQSNKWPITIKEESFCNAEINRSAVWSVWGIRTFYVFGILSDSSCLLFVWYT